MKVLVFFEIPALFFEFFHSYYYIILRYNLKYKNNMVGKMSLCIIKYTYTRYVGVDIEKYTRGIYEYVKEAFGELQPQMSEPGTIPDMPDYLDVVLIKKDGSNFLEMDIVRRAINIPRDYQLEGLVLEISITNCDGTEYKKTHHYHP